MTDHAGGGTTREQATQVAQTIFDLESTGGMDDLAFLEGRAIGVIEALLLAECDRRSRAVEALKKIASAPWPPNTSQDIAQQALKALASPAPAAEDGRT
jgi:hypothetical protein